MPPKAVKASITLDAETQAAGQNETITVVPSQSVRQKYPRRPTAKQLAQFIAQILAEDKKPKRTRPSRVWNTTKVKQPKPSIAVAPSTRPKCRLQLRSSMYDYVQTDLQDRGLNTCYHERVYIVAKNIPTESDDLTVEEQLVEDESIPNKGSHNAASKSEITKTQTSAPVVFKMQLRKPKGKVQMDPLAPQPVEESQRPIETVETFISKTPMGHDADGSDGSDATPRTSADYSVGSEEGDEEEDSDQELEPDVGPEVHHRESVSKADFLHSFREKIHEIKLLSEHALNDVDKLGGLLLCMDDYSLLVVEGTEDMVTEFMKRLHECINDFWCENRVFFIEDVVDTTYFMPMFYCYRTAAINVNEKFPNATPNDPYLMREQHRKVYNKIQAVVQTLGNDDAPYIRLFLPSNPYNRLMPEVQRLDMVLSSTRFYRTLEQYLSSFDLMISRNDDIAMTWPEPYNYTPLRSFHYTHFDANLTFPSYGQTEAKERGRRSSESERTEGEGGGTEETSEEQKERNEEEWVDQTQEEEEEHIPEVDETAAYSQDTEHALTSHDSVELFYADPLNGIDAIDLEKFRKVRVFKTKKPKPRLSHQIRWVVDRDMLHEHRDESVSSSAGKSSRVKGFGGYRERFSIRQRSTRSGSISSRHSTIRLASISHTSITHLYEKDDDSDDDAGKRGTGKQKRRSISSQRSGGRRASRDSRDSRRRSSTHSQGSVRSGHSTGPKINFSTEESNKK